MAKRGRPKKKTFNELLREKMQSLFATAVERQMPKTTEEVGKYDGFKTSEKTRETNRKAVIKYRSTEKGKECNRKSCKTYYQNHPERAKGYVARYKEKFEAKYGCKLSTWFFWLKKLRTGEIKPEEVPEKFAKILKDWRKKNGRISQRI